MSTYLSVHAEPVEITFTCHCCRETKHANMPAWGCGCHTRRYCSLCLKCEEHCTCPKPRLYPDFAKAHHARWLDEH